VGDGRAGDVCKWHLEDGLLSEKSEPTEEGEKSDVPLVLNFGGCIPACDGSEHLCDVGVGVFLFEETGVGEEGTEVGTWDIFRGEADIFCVLESGDGRATRSWY
jgi:hypothetical protein